jgi:uncharacterized protein (TIGR02145 family)
MHTTMKFRIYLSMPLLCAVFLYACTCTNSGNSKELAADQQELPAKATEVKIGKQTWATANLNVDKFRNGNPIPQAKTPEEMEKAIKNQQPAWCYYDNDPANGEKYGKLYNWYAVNDPRGVAPKGWHLPSNDEWTALVEFLGGEDAALNKIKDSTGWLGYGCQECEGGSEEFKKICSACKGTQQNSKNPINANGDNSSGFSALPGGYLFGSTYRELGKISCFWSQTGDYFFIFDRFLSASVLDKKERSNQVYSIRCIKN